MRKVSSIPYLLLWTGRFLQPCCASLRSPSRRQLQQQQQQQQQLDDDGGNVTPTSTTTTGSSNNGNDDEEDAVTFFDASISYVVLLPGAIQYDIPLEDYSMYLVATMDELAKELALQVFDPNETLPIQGPTNDDEEEEERTNTTVMDDLYVEAPTEMDVDAFDKTEFSSSLGGEGTTTTTNTTTTIPMPHVGLELPTSIEQVQNVGFTDTPTLTTRGVFVQGPCPTSLGNKQRDRCVQVTASIRLLLLTEPPTTNSAQVIAALQSVFEMALENAVGAGRLYELVVEQFPWTNMVVLSGYNVSATTVLPNNNGEDANSTRVVPEEVEDTNEISSLSIPIIVGISIGVFLLLVAVILLVVGRTCYRSTREKTRIIAKHVTEQEKMERTSACSSPEPSNRLETATGLEWGPTGEELLTVPYHEHHHRAEIGPATPTGHDRNNEIVEDDWTANPLNTSHHSSSVSSGSLNVNSHKGDKDETIRTPSTTTARPSSSGSVFSVPSVDDWTANPLNTSHHSSSVSSGPINVKGNKDETTGTPSTTTGRPSSSGSVFSVPSVSSSTSSQSSTVISSRSDIPRFRGLGTRIKSVSPILEEEDESVMRTPDSHRRTRTTVPTLLASSSSSIHGYYDDESTATSLLDQSIDSDVATVDLASGAVVIIPKSSTKPLHDVRSHLSPMDVKDFDALEAAILVGDWNAIAAMGNEADATEEDLDMSTHSYGTLESAAVYKTPTRNGERRRIGVGPWNAPEGVKVSGTSRLRVSREEQPRPNAWQALLESAQSSELANVMSRGDWASVLITAAKYATVDVPVQQELSSEKGRADEINVPDFAQSKFRKMTEV